MAAQIARVIIYNGLTETLLYERTKGANIIILPTEVEDSRQNGNGILRPCKLITGNQREIISSSVLCFYVESYPFRCTKPKNSVK